MHRKNLIFHLGLTLPVCLMLALPLCIAGIVSIETEPPGAHIRINTLRAGISPAKAILQPGHYLVTATLNGYFAGFDTITVGPEPQQEALRIQLEPIPATLLIKTTPPGGQVTVEGQARGLTPILMRNVAPGLLACIITAEGYAPLHIRYNVQPGKTALLNLQMQREAAEITIESDPPAATTKLNGTQYDFTPVRVTDIPAGQAELEIARRGYRTFSETLSLRTGESRHINVTLLPEPSMLLIASTPERSRVLIDGNFRGRTPLRLPALQVGVHQLTLEHPAYRTLQTNITIKAGQQHAFDFALEVTGGTLSISTTPPGASVLLNNIFAGETPTADSDSASAPTPLTIHPLPEGPHKISIFAPGYRPIQETIQVAPHAQIQRQYALARIPVANYEITTKTNMYVGYWAETNQNETIELEFDSGIIRKIPREEATRIRRIR